MVTIRRDGLTPLPRTCRTESEGFAGQGDFVGTVAFFVLAKMGLSLLPQFMERQGGLVWFGFFP